MKMLVVFLFFSISALAQTMPEQKIKNYARSSIDKALNQDVSWYESKRYMVQNVSIIATAQKIHGNRLYEVIADTYFTCIDTSNRDVVLKGKCSVVLNRGFRKTSLWKSKVDQETRCYCGDLEIN